MNNKKKIALCAAVPLLFSNVYWVAPAQIHAISSDSAANVDAKEEVKYPVTIDELKQQWDIQSQDDDKIVLGEYQGGPHAVIPSKVNGKQIYITSFPGGSVRDKDGKNKPLTAKEAKIESIITVSVDSHSKVKAFNSDLAHRPIIGASIKVDNDKLSYIDLSAFDVSDWTSYSEMFRNRTSIKTIIGLKNWGHKGVTDLGYMFAGTNISDIKELESWDISDVTRTSGMFKGTNISDLTPLTNWKTGKITDMGTMFAGCRSLVTLAGLEKWDVTSVNSDYASKKYLGMNGMFSNSGVKDVSAIKGWNVKEVIDLWNMFNNTPMEFANLSGWELNQNVNLKGFNTTPTLFMSEKEKPLLVISKENKLSKDQYDYKSNNRVGLKPKFIINGTVVATPEMPIVIKDEKQETYETYINKEKEKLTNIVKTNTPVGHEFVGWKVEKPVTNAYEAFTGTYIAQYKPIVYKVEFDANGGNANPKTQDVPYGSHVTAPTNPTKTDSVVKEWVDEKTGKVWDFKNDTMPAGNIKLKAVWTDEINIDFNLFGGDFELDSNFKDQKFKIGDKLPQPKVNKVGYALVGWYKDANFTQPWDFEKDVLPADANFKLYAKWVKNVEALNHVPTIDAKDVVLTVGDKFDVLAGVTAKDNEDGVIALNESNVVANDVNVNKAGVYHVTYKVTDKVGASAEKTITVTVNAKISESPKTGDPTSLGMLGSMFVTSAGVIAASMGKRRKK